jgi:prepilin-type N-terminal cleavage/methylation domain-containing protein
MGLSKRKVPFRGRWAPAVGGSHGLTLVEVLIALVLTGLILAAVYNLFGSQENTQVLVDQLSEMNQNLRIAANTILMDMRQAGYHVEDGVASSGVGRLNAITVQDGGTGNPDQLTVLYAIPGFEANLIGGYTTPGAQAPIDDGCPPVAGDTIRTCGQSSPTCFCSGDLVIMTDGRSSSVFQVTSDDAADGETQLELGGGGEFLQQRVWAHGLGFPGRRLW